MTRSPESVASDAVSRRFVVWIVVIAIGALVGRVAWVYLMKGHEIAPDGVAYFFSGASVASGHGFVSMFTGRPDAVHPPLWGLVLAIPPAFGWHSVFSAQIFGAMVGDVDGRRRGVRRSPHPFGTRRSARCRRGCCVRQPVDLRATGSVGDTAPSGRGGVASRVVPLRGATDGYARRVARRAVWAIGADTLRPDPVDPPDAGAADPRVEMAVDRCATVAGPRRSGRSHAGGDRALVRVQRRPHRPTGISQHGVRCGDRVRKL